MSKGSGMGRKRIADKLSKGKDKCDAASHSKQCGSAKEVTKGKKAWMSEEKEIQPFYADIFVPESDE